MWGSGDFMVADGHHDLLAVGRACGGDVFIWGFYINDICTWAVISNSLPHFLRRQEEGGAEGSENFANIIYVLPPPSQTQSHHSWR